MSEKEKKNSTRWEYVRACFELTHEERIFLASVLAIAAIGLVARYMYLRSEKADFYQPEGLEHIAREGGS